MGAVVDVALAEELTNAYATKTIVSVPLSSREAGFDLATACAIEAELTRVAEGAGRNSLRSPALCLGERSQRSDADDDSLNRRR